MADLLPMPLPRLLAALLVLLSIGAATLPARAESPPGCELYWRLVPQWSDTDPRLVVSTSTNGIEAAPQEWRPRAEDPRLVMGPRHLYAAGAALLPVPPALAGRSSLQMCLRVEGLTENELLASSLHTELAGADRLLRWQGSPALAREMVLGAGALQVRERPAEGQRLVLLMPPVLADRAEALADEAATTLAAQRRFWRASDPGRLLLLLQADEAAAPATLARTQAVLLRAPAAALSAGPALRLQLGRASLRGWFRERFGPTAYEQQPDEAASAWFVEGFSLFYALRLAALDGWPVDDLAAALTALWRQDGAAASSPWLPLQWHTELRERGGEGLDSVLRRLMLPAAQARPAGRLSSPQAGHRLFAALRPQLGDEPRQEVLQVAQAMSAAQLNADDFGPCFKLHPAERRVQAVSATPSAACRAWLAGTTPDSVAATPAARAAEAKEPGAKAASARPVKKTAAARKPAAKRNSKKR